MLMDPQQRLLFHSAWQRIENAGYTPSQFSKITTAVLMAVSYVDYGELIRYYSRVDEFSSTVVVMLEVGGRMRVIETFRASSE